jgi:hypothetical protein
MIAGTPSRWGFKIFYIVDVANVSEALVVNHNIIALCPIRVLIQFQEAITCLCALMVNCPLYGQFRIKIDCRRDNFSLRIIIMTAASSN